MSRLVTATFDRAVDLLHANSVKEGIKASTSYYNQVWARDTFITFVGANLLGDGRLLATAAASVRTFSRSLSDTGQVANFWDLSAGAPEYGYSGSTDSSCWYILGVASLFAATEDRALLKGPFQAAVRAYRWLRCQDANNSWLVDSPPGADWMDAAVQRSGKTSYVNALFLAATKALHRLTSAARTAPDPLLLDYDEHRQRFADVFTPGEDSPDRVARYWPRMGAAIAARRPLGLSRRHCLHYVAFSRLDERFDTFSNVLCVLTGAMDDQGARSALRAVAERRIDEPYPCKALFPPYEGEGAAYDSAFDRSVPVQHRSTPYAYHNGAVWPFIGGYYVSALNLSGSGRAPGETEALARANGVKRPGERTGFNEWIHSSTLEPLGQYGQSWNAGAYIAAVLSAKGKHPFGFLG